LVNITRRSFLKSLGIGAAGFSFFEGFPGKALASGALSIDLGESRLKYYKENYTICSWCGVGCGIIVYTQDNKVVHIEGDPDNPINEGTLCPKGAAISDVSFIIDKNNQRVPNPARLNKVLYRAPKSTNWEEKDWDWALDKIAQKIKETRNTAFELKDNNGVTVNRTQAIANLGSASIDNEENYLVHKLVRALGLINVEHHARL